MEMENSRRSAVDRSRDLGLKRQRLALPDDMPADRTSASSSAAAAAVGSRERQFFQSRAGVQQPSAVPRLPRTAEREEPSRVAGGSYQELLAQYKTALAELTFNSKPIITNLTIIAGENLHAAKGIAAIICANILEVPSEQKLPSLYLLDSIVKNIGRDYIKQFSGRLPEVFCKAYKQVDSSVHSSMRHLFGTWKGVFPAVTLQLIEKELGFTSVLNGSSGSASSKLDSQAQGPTHSIHVNPKYLEARQRLQQTNRAKELDDHDISSGISSFSDLERSNRTTLAGRTRQWENVSTKNMQRPQREIVNDTIQDKKGFRNVKGLEFSSDISQELDIGVGRVSDRIKERDEHNTYYGVNVGSSQSLFSRRNTFDINNSYEAYQESASGRANNQLATNMSSVDRNNIGTSKSWKNSEEEEYIWDDMNSKATDSGGSGTFMRSGWKNDDNVADKAIVSQEIRWHDTDTEHLQHKSLDALIRSAKASKGEGTISAYKDLEDHSMEPHSRHDNDSRRNIEASPDSLYAQQSTLEYQTNSKWVPHKASPSAIGLRHKRSNSSQSEEYPYSYAAGFSTNSGVFGQRLHQVQPASPSDVPSSASVHAQHNKLPNVPNYSQPRAKQVHPVSTKNHAQPLHMMSESISSPSEPFQNPETISASSGTRSQLRDHHPIVHQSQPSESLPQPPRQNSRLLPSSQGSGMQQIGKLSVTSNSDSLSIEGSGDPDASKLLAAILKSGILPSTSLGNSQDLKMLPPLPKGPPPIQALTSAAPSIPTSSLSLPDSSISASVSKQLPDRDLLPPLPPGPPPSFLGTNLDSSKPGGSPVNPLSTLLSSLVAKGLLSSPSTEPPIASVAQVSDNLKTERSYIPAKIVDQAASTMPIKNILPAFPRESSAAKSVDSVNDVLSHSTVPELRDLIGVEFKSEIVRGFHPSVISSLFDDLKHQCDICGLRCRHEDDIQNHFDWHASKESEMSNSRKFRRWYANTRSWVDTETAQSGMAEMDILFDEIIGSDEKLEPMVPADESQSICILCGEPFEDFYSEERDEWMYKGTTYLNLSDKQGDVGFVDKTTAQLPIVHAQCIA